MLSYLPGLASSFDHTFPKKPKSGFTTFSSHERGFTLVELLVVITIIAILSVIGVTVFTGIQKNARDTRKKGDVESIIKAYEVRYASTGSYGTTLIEGTAFASGSVPTPPEGGSYDVMLDNSTGGIKVCSTLADGSAFCQGSIQEQAPTGTTNITYLSGAPAPTPTPTPTPAPTPTPTPAPTPVPDNQNLWFGDITHNSANDCNNLSLWVCDKDYPKGPITVNVYDGPKSNNKLVVTGQTSFIWGGTNTAAVCGTDAQNTGFSVATPTSLKDGKNHTLYYYGLSLNINGQPGSKGEIGGSSEPFKCPR